MCIRDSFYPMDGGVAVYTDGDLSYYNALGARERTMYAPEAYAVLSGGGDAVIIYEPTNDTVTYAFADGSTASASAGEPGFTGPATTATPEELSLEGNEQNAAGGETGNADGEGGSSENAFTEGSGDWFEQNRPSGSGSGSGGSSSSSGSGDYDIPTFTEKDS